MPQSSADRSQNSPSAKKPVDKFTDGPVHVSIWENQGAKGAFRTATVQLRYKDGQDKWQTGTSYNSSDLMHLECAAREARSRIESWRHSQSANKGPTS